MKIILLLLSFIIAVNADSHQPDKCVDCNDPNFSGFGYAPTEKCGCCPWPCCCQCIGGEPDCTHLIDLALILDASGSIAPSNWDAAQDFLKDLVSIFPNIGTDQLVAAITYSKNASVEWTFSESETSSLTNLKNAIDGLENVGKFTNTGEALEKADKEVFVPGGGDRANAPNVGVVLTDGKANFRKGAALAAVAANLRSKAKLICIGITNNVIDQELEDICGDNVFRVTNFDQLKGILLDAQKEICVENEKCYCCCTPEQFFGGGGSRYYPF